MHRSDWMVWPKEAQRREERRAEVRLAEGLQRLDEAKHYQLNTLNREQRSLHRHLIAIKTGNWRRGLHAVGPRPPNHDLSLNPLAASYKNSLLPIIPSSGKEPDRPRPGKLQSSCSLQTRVQEFISSRENRGDNSTALLCLPELKLQPPNTLPPEREEKRERDTLRDRGRKGQMSLWETDRDRPKDSQKGKELMEMREKDRERVEGVTGTSLPSSPSPLPDSLAPDGQLRTVYVLPNFAQALAEARKARYIRHHGRPSCERELSIREIFSKNSKDTHNKHCL
ncbi:coiled-coil domain-containing protein 190 [Hoplias malabaricus]|uniref:coiled-coil domain-containing protein 190 n=1 Tax=Hoplias malabaricus TaxID=27720 RepID=UPI003462F550